MSQRVELDLLRRLEAMTKERDEALAKADQYKRDWYAAKSEFGSAMAKMREAIRAAEKRELEALAELDEQRANIETLKTHVETLREAWRSASDEVTRLRAESSTLTTDETEE